MKNIHQTENIEHDNKKFRVAVNFSGAFYYEVWAQDEDAAHQLALEEFDSESEFDVVDAITDTETDATPA
jgi:hypothetical protein